MRALTLALAAGALCAACHQDGADRRQTLSRAGELDRAIAAGPVVRDLRSRTDSGSILYTTPTNLARTPAPAPRDSALNPRPTAGRRDSVTAR